MELKVEVVSKDTIKPSSPTPIDLRNYKLSIFDQLAASFTIPIVLFYPKNPNTSILMSHDHLKKTVSLTLTQMYPLAGRLKDMSVIECNDQGAVYIHARVDEDMARLLQCPELLEVMKTLLPYDPHDFGQELSLQDEALLSVQVNEFSCGGVAIGVCIRHVIVDAAGAVSFLKKWAETNFETSNNINDNKQFVFDCTSLFPPLGSANHLAAGPGSKETMTNQSFIIKRFRFSEADVAALQEKAKYMSNDIIIDAHSFRRPTRVEAVSAFIWKATKAHIMLLSVNLRSRMVPPFPPHAIGNFVYLIKCHAITDGEAGVVDYKALTQKVAHSIHLVTDGYVRKVFSEGAYLKEIFSRIKLREDTTTSDDKMELNIGVTSWCRFPFYELDFGWGKPVFVGTCIGTCNTVVLMDTSDGKGIEAWIALAEKDMQDLEQNPEFVSSCSLILSV